MRVVHLFSDWKWTGPAGPTVDLCRELRAMGCDAVLACRTPPAGESSSIVAKAAAAGVPTISALRMDKHPNLVDNVVDLILLREFVERTAIDLLHVHTSHDHLLGGLASRWGRGRPPVVRTNHRGRAFPPDPGTRVLLESMTDGYISYAPRALAADRASFHLDQKRTIALHPGMRLERYTAFAPTESERKRHGIGDDRIVVGVVARVQRHRRFDILLDGFARALTCNPRLLLVVVGRGTHREEIAIEPVRRMGLERDVLFTGYVADRYLETLAMFDIMVFLVPGSDGTCRALREGMAMGKPSIAARRGMIPEIVGGDGECGALIDDTPEGIAGAMLRLAADDMGRREMGARARERAVSRFPIEHEAGATLQFYRRVLGEEAPDFQHGVGNKAIHYV